jgi:hypothetical protein
MVGFEFDNNKESYSIYNALVGLVAFLFLFIESAIRTGDEASE